MVSGQASNLQAQSFRCVISESRRRGNAGELAGRVFGTETRLLRKLDATRENAAASNVKRYHQQMKRRKSFFLTCTTTMWMGDPRRRAENQLSQAPAALQRYLFVTEHTKRAENTNSGEQTASRVTEPPLIQVHPGRSYRRSGRFSSRAITVLARGKTTSDRFPGTGFRASRRAPSLSPSVGMAPSYASRTSRRRGRENKIHS